MLPAASPRCTHAKEAPQPRGATPTSGTPRPLQGRPGLASLPARGAGRSPDCGPGPRSGTANSPGGSAGNRALRGSRGSGVRVCTGRVGRPDVAGCSSAHSLQGDPGGGVGGRGANDWCVRSPRLKVEVVVRGRRAGALGTAAAPGKVGYRRGEVARPLWGRVRPGQRCSGGQRCRGVERPGASDVPSSLPARRFRLTLQSWAQDLASILRESIRRGRCP